MRCEGTLHRTRPGAHECDCREVMYDKPATEFFEDDIPEELGTPARWCERCSEYKPCDCVTLYPVHEFRVRRLKDRRQPSPRRPNHRARRRAARAAR